MAAEKEVIVKHYAISNDPEYVLIFYSADWCAPCQKIRPHVDRLCEAKYLSYLDQRLTTVAELRKSGFKDRIPCFVKTGLFVKQQTTKIQTSSFDELDVFLDLDVSKQFE